jgi:hypothetical protein
LPTQQPPCQPPSLRRLVTPAMGPPTARPTSSLPLTCIHQLSLKNPMSPPRQPQCRAPRHLTPTAPLLLSPSTQARSILLSHPAPTRHTPAVPDSSPVVIDLALHHA